MPHADSAFIPSTIQSKEEFWGHVATQVNALLDGQRNWVSNLANTASVIYHSLQSFRDFGVGDSAVNWCGFYVDTKFMPPSSTKLPPTSKECSNILLLGPFCGKPACQYIRVPSVVSPSEDQDTTGTGVCADAFAFRRTVLVEDVEKYPGHIACDGDTKSEIVVPLLNAQGECVGVLDLDCLAIAAFSEADKKGLEAIAALVGSGSDWAILST